MNFLDIILIIILVLVVGGIAFSIYCIKEGDGYLTIVVLLIVIPILLFIVPPIFSFDKASGATVGTITSTDRSFFKNKNYVYVKTTENTEEKYCVEDESIYETAQELVGKKVKISYGTRVGFHSTGECSEAPIEKIEEIEDNK